MSLGVTIAFTVWRFKGYTGGIMKRILLVLMSVFMFAFLVGCGNDASKPTESAKPSTSEKITVQAAASLKGALTELADAYKKSHNLADD